MVSPDMLDMETVYLAIPLASLFGAAIAGFFGRQIGRAGAHWVTILGAAIYNQSVYTWMVSDGIRFEIGFLVDGLTALMMVVVTSVSLAVHVYTIGYMHDDPGYQRFFSYISLFTFSMLMLVMSNNFLQLFFGWEAVGLVSYLLIGFWLFSCSPARSTTPRYSARPDRSPTPPSRSGRAANGR